MDTMPWLLGTLVRSLVEAVGDAAGVIAGVVGDDDLVDVVAGAARPQTQDKGLIRGGGGRAQLYPAPLIRVGPVVAPAIVAQRVRVCLRVEIIGRRKNVPMDGVLVFNKGVFGVTILLL